MNDELARRAVACKHWRWMPGMLSRPWHDEYGEESYPAWRLGQQCTWPGVGWHEDALPDLDDPATLGCLLALVREAWGRHVWAMQLGGHWCVGDGLNLVGPTCATEAEALVAALEAAP